MTIQEFEQVVLTADLPRFHLKVGDVGTVVDISPNGQQVTLEFFNFRGDTVAVIPVSASQIRSLGEREITHARMLDEV
jgi:hypothetical protein